MKRKICTSLLLLAMCACFVLQASAYRIRLPQQLFCLWGFDRFCEAQQPEVPPSAQPSEPNEQQSSVHAYEREVVRLVNAERAANGLPDLTLREDLCTHARRKSQDMHDSGYFSHTSPTYGSPFEMMRSFGITYRTAGENIAMGYHTPQQVVQAWMRSESHRENILSASYTHLGVGYVADGGYWTQWFVG